MFVSRTASISEEAELIGDVIILGPTKIGGKTRILPNVIIGFPVRSKIKNYSLRDLEVISELSSGSIIGERVIVRSGTVIYEEAVIGDEVEFGHNVMVREKTKVGSKTLIGSGTIIDGYTSIGSSVKIQSGVYIPTNTVIGNNVFLAPRVVITNDKYPPSSRLVTTYIEDNSVIGANATLIAGVRIGEGAVVGAGSVVTKDVPPYKVVLGIPARVVGERDDYEAKKKLYEKG